MRDVHRSGDRTNTFEGLENRRLLAQVAVTSFGANPNDGGDDTAAIRNAINASAPGDTIYFARGTYNINQRLLLKGGRTYRGDDPNATTIRGNDRNQHIFYLREDNTRVENLTLDGKGIMIDKPSLTMVSGVTINNNIFKHAGAGSDNHSITFTTGLQNTAITNNRFENSPHGVYGYYWNKLTIANNEFVSNGQGIHVDDHRDSSRDMLIEQNLFTGIKRMAIEYQGGGWNTIVQDNWYEKPVLSSTRAANDSVFAYSIIADRSHNTLARRNVIIAPERPDGIGVRIGFEIGGDNAIIEDNYVSGIHHVVAANDNYGSTSVLVRNNFWENIQKGPVGRGLTQQNNGSHVKLTWNISRGKPGRNFRLGGSAPSTPTPNPAPPPSGGATVQPSAGFDYLSDMNWASVSNGWGAVEKNRSNGESGANDGRTLTLNGTSYAKGLGVHASSQIVYNLNGQYKGFFSDIGVDDEVGNGGSVAFQVFLDNVKVYDSGTMTGSAATKSVSLDVSGKNQLRLVVSDAGNGNASDHANWANARLSKSTSGATTPTTPTTPAPSPAPSGTTWLSDLNWTSAINGWGVAEKNRSNGENGSTDGKTLTIGSKTYSSGIGVHAGSDIKYNIAGKYKTFSTDIGIDKETGGRGTVVFQVWADGKLKFDSGIVRGTNAARSITVDVAGVKELRLVVTTANDGNMHDHGDWAGAKLTA